ncbi:murein hydrolase activator EnvC family protein [Lutibacter holmesii]|uniref:Murein hydrolase activator EnvC family protein n=1 Tax=Lutibacter holmesii TaxID=1137985 RepID=A0ABW3WMS4_9FLAO
MQPNIKYIFLFLALIFSVNLTAQKKTKREVLEARRIQLQKDKVYINALLSNTIRKEKNVLVELVEIDGKIKTSDELINVISKESKELDNEIYLNQLEINRNKRDLAALKKDYGDMIYKSYKSKSQNSRIMFLLSSENFFQAYKRFQYMKQYASFRKAQGDEIQEKTIHLQELAENLKVKKQLKQELLAEKKQEQSVIEKEKQQREILLSQVKEKENKYKNQIKKFIKQEAVIDAQIDKIIRDAIAASKNKPKAATSKAGSFALTAEAKALASQFVANKGKLPWPVEKGYVSMYYGKQRHPIVKTATIQSNGVRIVTNKGSKARAVFNGTVLAVQVTTGNKKAVLIQHGNYITVYKNLQNVTVKKGDKVKTKQEIGTIFTDKVTGKTIIGFVLSKNAVTENPKNWIYKM